MYEPPPKERKEDMEHKITKGEEMQKIILKIAKWLIKYVDGYHVARNGGGRKKKA